MLGRPPPHSTDRSAILLLEANEIAQPAMSGQLAGLGYPCHPCSNIAEGRSLARRHRYMAMLLTVRSPDAHELALVDETLRPGALNLGVPVVVLGCSRRQTEYAHLQAMQHVVAYLSDPCVSDDLALILHAIACLPVQTPT